MSSEIPNINPFESSQVVAIPDVESTNDTDLHVAWRDDEQVVTAVGAELPRRCVGCNQAGATSRVVDKLWIEFTGVTRLRVTYWLCKYHARWPVIKYVGILLILFGNTFAILKLAFGFSVPASIIFPILLSIACLAIMITAVRKWQGIHVDVCLRRDRMQAVTGCGAKFVASLSPLAGREAGTNGTTNATG